MPVGAVYLGSAAIVALLGAGLLVWALFADRSRGRKRCPKCWYDMSAAVSLRCPECGHEAKNERRFLKTRRRWKFVMASVLVFALAGFLAVQPKVQQDGWWSVMPTTVMLMYFQFVQDDVIHAAIAERISERHVHPAMGTPMFVPDQTRLYRWQWRLLARKVVNLLADNDTTVTKLRLYVQWSSSLREFVDNEHLSDRLLQSIVQQFQHEDPVVRSTAAMFSVNTSDPDATLAHLRPLLNDVDPFCRRGAISALGLLVHYTQHEASIGELIKALEDPDEDARALAASRFGSVARFGHTRSAEIRDALLSSLDRSSNEHARFRSGLVRAIAAHYEPADVVRFLHRMLAHDDPNVRAGALEFLTTCGEVDRRAFFPAVVKELQTPSATDVGRWSAAWLLQGWEDADDLRGHYTHLRQLFEHEDEETHQAAWHALQRIGVRLDRRLTAEEHSFTGEP